MNSAQPDHRSREHASNDESPLDLEQRLELQRLELDVLRAEVRFFERIATVVATEPVPTTALSRLLELACRDFGWPLGHIAILHDPGGLRSSGIWFVSDPSLFGPLQPALEQRSFDAGLTQQALQTQQTVHVADLSADCHVHEEAIRLPYAGLAVPLRTGTDIVGIMELFAAAATTVDERQRLRIEHLAGHLGTLIARHSAAQALDCSSQRVEQQVRDRTAELVQGRQEAEAAAVLKASLLATMTHELRTPLSGVHGMASLLLDSELSEAQRDYACHILSASESLLSIVDDVLDFSRGESGRLQIEDVDVDPVGLVDDVLTLLGSRAADKRIELASLADPSVPRVVGGDPGRVRQILTNLVGNALKFTEAGRVLVRLSFLPGADAADAHLHFEVEDTGIGIAPEAIGQLFQPFVQADASTKRLFGGTGLGLSISRRLAEAMGGAIGVTSTPGSGSTFWFTIRASRHAGRYFAPTGQLAGTDVIVMTRSPIVHQVVSQTLEFAGATVVWVRRSGEIVELARKRSNPFHAALVDLQQREARATAGGAEFHRLLGHSCRVVALAYPWNRPNDGSSGEFDAIVTVPISHRSLLGTVSRLLDRARPTPSEAPHSQFDGDLRGTRILLVDDTPINLKVASAFLTKLGCETVTASNGVEALEALTHERFDLVLMDCQMPVMDGYEAARAIRAQRLWPSLPIIAMTASAEPAARERCLEAGMSDYLVKPVRPRVLAETLLRWLSHDP